MKIAYIGLKGLPSKGGTERVVEAIVRRLSSKHYITVYCSNRYTPPGVQVSGVRLLRLPTLSGKHSHMLSLDLIAALHALLFGRYDLVHVHNMEASFVIPLLKIRFKVIATAHGWPYTVEKWSRLARAIIRLTEYPFVFLSDVLTSVSQQQAKDCQRKYRRPIYYIPNGVDPFPQVDCKKAAKILRDSGVNANQYIMFAAGRIIPLKGCHLLIEAFRSLTSNCDLVIVGDLTQMPAYGQQLHQMARVDDRIHFISFTSSKKQLMGIVRGAELFIFPSINEGMSLMLLEVASLGVPIVCSDIPENTDVLGQNALYLSLGNVEALTDKLRWALAHSDQMKKIGAGARKWVRNSYSWKNIIEQYDSLYNQVVGAR